MPDVTKTRRIELAGKASDAASVALARLQELSNSGNPDVAARATALLILDRNEQDDLRVLQAILGNKPVSQLKPISDENLALLAALENSIDTRIQNSRLINASLAGVSEILRSAEAIGQILKETP